MGFMGSGDWLSTVRQWAFETKVIVNTRAAARGQVYRPRLENEYRRLQGLRRAMTLGSKVTFLSVTLPP